MLGGASDPCIPKSWLERYPVEFKRPCPYVPLHNDNQEALEIFSYVQAGGWVQKIGVEKLIALMRDSPEKGETIFRRIIAAMGSEEYRNTRENLKQVKKHIESAHGNQPA